MPEPMTATRRIASGPHGQATQRLDRGNRFGKKGGCTAPRGEGGREEGGGEPPRDFSRITQPTVQYQKTVGARRALPGCRPTSSLRGLLRRSSGPDANFCEPDESGCRTPTVAAYCGPSNFSTL